MPVTGPDLRYARNLGKEAAKEILQLLQDKYGCSPPWRDHPFKKIVDEKDRAIAQIVNGVIELMIWDACESF